MRSDHASQPAAEADADDLEQIAAEFLAEQGEADSDHSKRLSLRISGHGG